MKNYIVTTRTQGHGIEQWRYYNQPSLEAVKAIHLEREPMPERCIIHIEEMSKEGQNNTYGIADHNGEYIDVSKTERGAKNYATRHGYTDVYKRFNNGYTIVLVATKNNRGVWGDENIN